MWMSQAFWYRRKTEWINQTIKKMGQRDYQMPFSLLSAQLRRGALPHRDPGQALSPALRQRAKAAQLRLMNYQE
jgi:hypothetical protein